MKTTMMATRRQVLVGGATIATLATLAACSKDEASDGPVKLVYWHRLPDKENMTSVEEIVKKWNAENPDIQVETKKFEGNAQESYAKIAQAVKQGDAPDLAQIGYGEIAAEYVAGDLEDVAKEIKEGKYAEHFAAGPMGQCTLGDVVVGLPQDTGPLCYAYNKAEFDALGISAPTTWAELKEAAKVAVAAGKYICTWQDDESRYRISGMAAGAGATWFSAEGNKWKVDIASEASKKMAAVQQELLDEGLMLKLSDGRWGDDWKDKLTSGVLIGCVVAGWEPGFMLLDLGVEKADWQLTYLPAFEDGKKMTGADGGSALCVIKGCKHKAEAVKFADWFNTQIDGLVSQGLVVAANTGTPVTPESTKALWGGQDIYAFLADANATMNPNFPYSPTWPTVGDELNKVGGRVTAGEATVEDMLTAAQEVAVSSLKSAGIDVAE